MAATETVLPTDTEYRLGVWKVVLNEEGRRYGHFEHVVEGAKYAHELLAAAEQAFIEERVDDVDDPEFDLERWYPGLGFEIEASTNEYRLASGAQAFFVTVGTLHRVYLGPEEGGRWGDVVEPIEYFVVESEAAAWSLRETLYGHVGTSGDEDHPLFGEYPDTGRSSSILGGDDYAIRVGVRPAEPDYPTSEYE